MHLRILLFFILASSAPSLAQTISPKFGDGLLRLKAVDSSWTMKIGARMQFLATAQKTSNKKISSNFLIRRARLKFGGYAFSPKLKYKLELGLSNKDLSGASKYTNNAPRLILDAVMSWNFHKNFELWFGQTKLPGNRERVISSASLQQVDRSRLNSVFNIDRDLGIQLRHHFFLSNHFLVREIFSIAQGEGRNITKGNIGGLQYTSRIELLPFGKFKSKGDYKGSDLKHENKPKLALGISYDYNDNAVKTRSNQGHYMDTNTGFYQTDISTLFFDAMFKYAGYSMMLEYANRQANHPIAKDEQGDLTGDIVQVGHGYNAQIGYLINQNWEVSSRFTHINLDEIVAKPRENHYTFGISNYIKEHNLKVQSDFTYIDYSNSTNQMLFRIQFDIHF